MANLTPPSPELVAASVENAARVAPLLGELIARYTDRRLPNDPDTSRTLQEAGMAILPGVRLEYAVEVAMAAHGARSAEEFGRFVVACYTGGHVYRKAQVA